MGLNVVVDVGHHDVIVLADSARRLAGLPVLFVGVGCPIDVIMKRRNEGQPGREGGYAVGTAADPVPAPVQLWQDKVHEPGIYDLEVDTSRQTPAESAAAIKRRLESGPPPSAVRALAEKAVGPATFVSFSWRPPGILAEPGRRLHRARAARN